MFCKKTELAYCSLSLNPSCYIHCVLIQQLSGYELLTPTGLEPQICFPEYFPCTEFFSAFLLFCPVFSQMFYVLYITAGVSDMADGAVARKTGTVSEFGSRLDTISDIVFVVVCMIKLIPVLDIPLWLFIWIVIIALIKMINIIFGYVMSKELVAAHTVMNKVTGIVLFILPLTITRIDLKYSGALVSAVATFAAI